jgi:glutamate decarboxylase
MRPFRLLSRGDQLPVFAFTTTGQITSFDVFDVSRRLRERGWLLPAYTIPADRTDVAVMRVVVRNGFTHDVVGLLLAGLNRLLPERQLQPGRWHPAQGGLGFHG